MSVRRFRGHYFANGATSWLVAKTARAGHRRSLGPCAVLLAVVMSGWSLSGCAQSEYERALASARAEQLEASFVGPESVPDELREMEFIEVDQGAGTEHLGAARMFREVGLFEFLDGYLINIPPSAMFLSDKERYAATHAASRDHERSGRTGEASSASVFDFEHLVLIGAYGAQAGLRRDLVEQISAEESDGAGSASGSGLLHEAFFEVLEECGRASPWPEVQLFVMGQGYAGDYLPQFVESDFDISLFEYRELLHVCGRYAATYPTLDPETRDELLAPQRAHYAQVILDLLDNQLPLVEVPPEYRAEIDDLRANGW